MSAVASLTSVPGTVNVSPSWTSTPFTCTVSVPLDAWSSR